MVSTGFCLDTNVMGITAETIATSTLNASVIKICLSPKFAMGI